MYNFVSRARGHDVIKLKKGAGGTSHGGGSKKSSLSNKHEHEPTVPLYPVAEKATLFTDKSSEEILNKSTKKKQTGDIGLPKVSGLILPSVKQESEWRLLAYSLLQFLFHLELTTTMSDIARSRLNFPCDMFDIICPFC